MLAVSMLADILVLGLACTRLTPFLFIQTAQQLECPAAVAATVNAANDATTYVYIHMYM